MIQRLLMPLFSAVLLTLALTQPKEAVASRQNTNPLEQMSPCTLLDYVEATLCRETESVMLSNPDPQAEQILQLYRSGNYQGFFQTMAAGAKLQADGTTAAEIYSTIGVLSVGLDPAFAYQALLSADTVFSSAPATAYLLSILSQRLEKTADEMRWSEVALSRARAVGASEDGRDFWLVATSILQANALSVSGRAKDTGFLLREAVRISENASDPALSYYAKVALAKHRLFQTWSEAHMDEAQKAAAAARSVSNRDLERSLLLTLLDMRVKFERHLEKVHSGAVTAESWNNTAAMLDTMNALAAFPALQKTMVQNLQTLVSQMTAGMDKLAPPGVLLPDEIDVLFASLVKTAELWMEKRDVGALALAIAKTFRQTGQFEKAFDQITAASSIFRLHGTREDIAATHVEKGRIFIGLEDPKRADTFCKLGQETMAAREKTEIYANALFCRSLVKRIAKQHRTEVEFLNEMISLPEESYSLPLRVDAMEALSWRFSPRTQADALVQHLKDMVELATRLDGDATQWTLDRLSNMASRLIDARQYANALVILDECKSLYSSGQGATARRQHWASYGTAYFGNGQTDDAFDAYGRALNYALEENDSLAVAVQYRNLATIHSRRRQAPNACIAYKEARRYFRKSGQIAAVNEVETQLRSLDCLNQ